MVQKIEIVKFRSMYKRQLNPDYMNIVELNIVPILSAG
jgi:hypothetical protein